MANAVMYTEAEMGRAFLRCLTSPEGLPGVGPVSRVQDELACQRGCPDYVAVKKSRAATVAGRLTVADAAVLSLLKYRAPRRREFIDAKSGLGPSATSRSLRRLLAAGLVKQAGEGAFVLRPHARALDVQSWAFELKLNKPRRAVFQAQQYRSFAERVVIVAPPNQIPLYDRFKPTMERWGLGLASFDPISGDFRFARRPQPRVAGSRSHKLYAASQLLSAKEDQGKRKQSAAERPGGAGTAHRP